MANPRTKAQGTVIWYDPRKGYGFANAPASPKVFIHYGALAPSTLQLKSGQKISFELERTAHGEVAHNIKPAA
jgi:cold shock protein